MVAVLFNHDQTLAGIVVNYLQPLCYFKQGDKLYESIVATIVTTSSYHYYHFLS